MARTIPGTGLIEFEKSLVDAFRRAGWRIDRHSSAGDVGADLLLDRNGKRRVVHLMVASEGRRDRLIPLLSQAILEARDRANFFRTRRPARRRCRQTYPSSRCRSGQSVCRALRVEAGAQLGFGRSNSHHPSELFSDLNQWMLKILLGQRLPGGISVPRQPIKNASQLAGPVASALNLQAPARRPT
jgi:hypothetical protein